MTYRPYPNVDRALAQVHRRQLDASMVEAPECLRPLVASFAEMGAATRRALEARSRLAVLGPDGDATELIQSIGDEQGYVELPRGVYRTSVRRA